MIFGTSPSPEALARFKAWKTSEPLYVSCPRCSRVVFSDYCEHCEARTERIREERHQKKKAQKEAKRLSWEAKKKALEQEESYQAALAAKRKRLLKLANTLRSRIHKALFGQQAPEDVLKSLGCSIEHFRSHIESLFQPGMSWDNHGVRGWHIDHVAPLCSFDLTNPQEFAAANHYKNLHPLWAKENLAKSADDKKLAKRKR